MFPGTVRLTQDNSRQRCKTGVNKTEGNEKPGKQEKKVNRECNSLHVSTVVFTTTNNAFLFFNRFCRTIKKRRRICLPKKCSK